MSTLTFTKSQINEIIKNILQLEGINNVDSKSINKIFNTVASGKKVKKSTHTKSSYMLFLDHFRKNLSDEEKKNMTQVAKNGGAKWKSLSDKEKEPFVIEAKKLKEEALSKLPVKEKRPKSAYILFLDDFRKTLSEQERKNVTQVAKDGGAAWRALSEKKKNPYIEKAESLKPEKKDKEVKPKKPRTGYQIFVAEFRSKLSESEKKELGIGGISKKASVGWNKLAEKGQSTYLKKSTEEKEKGVQIYDF